MRNLLQYIRGKGNSLLRGASLRTGLNLNKPGYVCAKMTMRCNSRCLHCNIWNTDYNEQELTTDDWYRILDELRAWLGSFNMVFTGGEALLRHDMIDILTYAVGKDIRCELLSNGIIVDDSLAKDIVHTGITQYTTSFDGIKAETHDRVRGKTGFHAKTLAAIYALCTEREKAKIPLKILLKTVISANNVLELAAIARFSQKIGVEVLFQPIEQNYGEEPDAYWYKNSPLWIHDSERLKDELAQLQELIRKGYPIGNSVDNLSSIQHYFESPDDMMASVQNHDTRTSVNMCRAAVSNFVISSNGDVCMCFRMAPIGNLRSFSPKDLWKKRQHCWINHCDFR